jgi:hypothetical protein
MIPFEPDAEIFTRDEDRLGRAPFAQQLARSIAAWRSPHSLTIALYGDYGAGKSSVKRLATEALAQEWNVSHEEVYRDVLDIEPWSWIHTDDWITAFFEELGGVAGAGAADPEEGERVARLFAGLGARVRGGSAALRVAAEIAKAAGEEVPGIRTALRAADLVREFAETKSEAASTEAASAAAVTLQQTKEEIARVLSARQRPLVVFVDEIDRLADEEIRTLFRVVRANADLPNLVLVLLFHRAVVENALESEGASGQEYLEKMVQVGLDLPEPPRDTLPDLFADRLVEAADGLVTFTQGERSGLRRALYDWFHAALYQYVRTPRDIVRHVNTFRFYLGGLVEDGELTVHPLDLLLLDIFRTHEPEVYHIIPRLKDELVGTYPMEIYGKPSERRTRAVAELVAHAENESTTRDLLAALFPLTAAVIRDDKTALFALQHEGASWARERRVAHPDMFDRYFAFTRGTPSTLQDRVEALVAEHLDREVVAAHLADAARRDELAEMLQRTLAFTDDIAVGDPAAFLAGLFDAGDVAEAGPELALRVVRGVLEAVRLGGDPVEPVLADALRRTNGIVYPVGVAQKVAEHPGRYGLEPSFAEFLDDQSRGLFRVHSSDGHLIQSRRLGYLLTRWRALDPGESEEFSEAEEWARKFSDGPYGIACIATAFSEVDLTSDPPRRRFLWERLERWLDLDVALDTLTRQLDRVNPDQRAVIDAFRAQAAERPSAAPEREAKVVNGKAAGDRSTVEVSRGETSS